MRGFKGVFKNVEATIKNGDEDYPELLIVSHYDTVENCPGADDNASAVAVMLEKRALGIDPPALDRATRSKEITLLAKASNKIDVKRIHFIVSTPFVYVGWMLY